MTKYWLRLRSAQLMDSKGVRRRLSSSPWSAQMKSMRYLLTGRNETSFSRRLERVMISSAYEIVVLRTPIIMICKILIYAGGIFERQSSHECGSDSSPQAMLYCLQHRDCWSKLLPKALGGPFRGAWRVSQCYGVCELMAIDLTTSYFLHPHTWLMLDFLHNFFSNW